MYKRTHLDLAVPDIIDKWVESGANIDSNEVRLLSRWKKHFEQHLNEGDLRDDGVVIDL
jgi:hypothetical protein